MNCRIMHNIIFYQLFSFAKQLVIYQNWHSIKLENLMNKSDRQKLIIALFNIHYQTQNSILCYSIKFRLILQNLIYFFIADLRGNTFMVTSWIIEFGIYVFL